MEKIKTLQAGSEACPRHKNHCAGFTLLELTVVILIAGIAVSLVVVAIGKMHEKRVFNEASKKVFLTLKYGHEISILERVPVSFNISEDNKSFWLEKDKAAYGNIQKLPERISISGEPVIFFPKGNSSGGIIKIEDDQGKEFIIEIDSVLGTPKFKGI